MTPSIPKQSCFCKKQLNTQSFECTQCGNVYHSECLNKYLCEREQYIKKNPESTNNLKIRECPNEKCNDHLENFTFNSNRDDIIFSWTNTNLIYMILGIIVTILHICCIITYYSTQIHEPFTNTINGVLSRYKDIHTDKYTDISGTLINNICISTILLVIILPVGILTIQYVVWYKVRFIWLLLISLSFYGLLFLSYYIGNNYYQNIKDLPKKVSSVELIPNPHHFTQYYPTDGTHRNLVLYKYGNYTNDELLNNQDIIKKNYYNDLNHNMSVLDDCMDKIGTYDNYKGCLYYMLGWYIIIINATAILMVNASNKRDDIVYQLVLNNIYNNNNIDDDIGSIIINDNQIKYDGQFKHYEETNV